MFDIEVIDIVLFSLIFVFIASLPNKKDSRGNKPSNMGNSESSAASKKVGKIIFILLEFLYKTLSQNLSTELRYFSEAQILLVDTLVLPSEMVAESVVNNIQSNSFDSVPSNVEYSFQILVALSLGKIFLAKTL